jgi:ribosomal protein L32
MMRRTALALTLLALAACGADGEPERPTAALSHHVTPTA